MKRPPEYLCQYGNCDVRLPPKRSYVIGKPHSLGAPRYCTAIHALLGLAKDVGIDSDIESILHQKGLL